MRIMERLNEYSAIAAEYRENIKNGLHDPVAEIMLGRRAAFHREGMGVSDTETRVPRSGAWTNVR